MKTVNRIIKSSMRSNGEFYNSLKAAYPGIPDWLFLEMDASYSQLSEYLNLVTTDLFNPFTRRSAYAFAGLNGYVPVEKDGALTTLTITLKQAMAKTLPIGYQVGGMSASGVFNIYELTAVGNSGGTNTITVAAKQKKTIANINIGTITSNDDFLEFIVDNDSYIGIIKSTALLKIDADTGWTRQDNIDLSTSTEKHFEMYYLSTGHAVFRFGDGTTGQRPPLNGVVYMTAEITNGILGAMQANTLTQNVGGDNDILSIGNTLSTGGNDPESVRSILIHAIRQSRLRENIFSLADVEIFAESKSSVSGGIAKAICLAGTGAKVGVPQLQIITSDMSAFPSGSQTTLIAEIKSKSPIESYDVDILTGNFLNVPIAAATVVRSGFTKSTTDKLVKFALAMSAIPLDGYIIGLWNDNGADYIRTNIINTTFNSLYGLTMPTATENQVDMNGGIDYIITLWSELLGSRTQRDVGQTLELADLYTMTNELYTWGLDTISITNPTAQITTPAADQFIFANSLTIT